MSDSALAATSGATCGPDFAALADHQPQLARCIELCALARGLSGDELLRALGELQSTLQLTLQSIAGEEWGTPKAPEKSGGANPAAAPDWTLEPIIAMDMAGYLTGWNRGAQILFGYTAEEAIGQHILFLYADEPGAATARSANSFSITAPVHGSRRRKKSGEIFRANLSLRTCGTQNDAAIGMEAHLSAIVDRLSPEENQRLHARIIEDSEEGILITDVDEIDRLGQFGLFAGSPAIRPARRSGRPRSPAFRRPWRRFPRAGAGRDAAAPAPGMAKSSAAGKMAISSRNRFRSASSATPRARLPTLSRSSPTSASCARPKNACSRSSTTTA